MFRYINHSEKFPFQKIHERKISPTVFAVMEMGWNDAEVENGRLNVEVVKEILLKFEEIFMKFE